jgi:hypothetical protein
VLGLSIIPIAPSAAPGNPIIPNVPDTTARLISQLRPQQASNAVLTYPLSSYNASLAHFMTP